MFVIIQLSRLVTADTILWPNFLVSTIIQLPVIWLLFSVPVGNANPIKNQASQLFLDVAIKILMLLNLMGLYQFLVLRYDDAFIGFYGRHGLGLHGLAIINGFTSVYYLARLKNLKNVTDLIYLGFFALSFLLCFFGMALAIFLISLGIFLLTRQKALLMVMIALPLLASLLFITFWLAPKTYKYNQNNINLAVKGLNIHHLLHNPEAPRKMVIFARYFAYAQQHTENLLVGIGPGTFNSRTSFLLNGDYSRRNLFENLFGQSKSEPGRLLAHPLWDHRILAQKYRDGTRNQPFSSILSLTSEYGLIFATLFLGLWIYSVRLGSRNKILDSSENIALTEFIKTGSIYLFLNLLTENLLEYSELALCVLVLKSAEIKLYLANQNSIA